MRVANEPFPTRDATVGPVPRVSLRVPCQIRLGAESHVTHSAAVRFLTSVNHHVLEKICFLSKFFSTVSTAVRFLSRVDLNVDVQVPHLRESSAAKATHVGFLSGVRVDVSRQTGALMKLLPQMLQL